MAAAAIIGGTLLSGMMQSRGATKAATAQARASQAASEGVEQRFGEIKEQLMPFIHMGAEPGIVDPALIERKRELEDLKSKVSLGVKGYAQEAAYQRQIDNIQKQIDYQQQARGTGTTPLQQQLAMAGVLGPEAQRKFYQGYVESPEVQFLREQGMQAINQQAAATGRLGSSSRLRALSELNQQLAQQGVAQQFNRLGALSGMQLGAAQALGGFGTQAAGMQGQALQAAGAAQAAGQAGRYGALGQTVSQLGALGAMQQKGVFDRPSRGYQTDYSTPMTSIDL